MTMTPSEAAAAKEKGGLCFIDVREPEEVASGFIKGAVFIPLGQITKEKLPPSKRGYIIYCRSGGRSRRACELLLKEDLTLVLYNLEGGFVAWKEYHHLQ